MCKAKQLWLLIEKSSLNLPQSDLFNVQELNLANPPLFVPSIVSIGLQMSTIIVEKLLSINSSSIKWVSERASDGEGGRRRRESLLFLLISFYLFSCFFNVKRPSAGILHAFLHIKSRRENIEDFAMKNSKSLESAPSLAKNWDFNANEFIFQFPTAVLCLFFLPLGSFYAREARETLGIVYILIFKACHVALLWTFHKLTAETWWNVNFQRGLNLYCTLQKWFL